MKKTFSAPPFLSDLIAPLVQSFSYDLKDSKAIAGAIKSLSDHYTTHLGRQTPWRQKEHQVAYLAYYWPLNFMRIQAVISEGQRQDFFKDVKTVIDFGSGLGTGQLALESLPHIERYLCIETSPEARELHAQWLNILKQQKKPLRLQPEWMKESDLNKELLKESLVLFSYSLNELSSAPTWMNEAAQLIILEPSTHQAGRQLQELRGTLIDQGYYAWAPCIHQMACPLLLHSKKDWCHDRIFIELPDWHEAIESHLPMTNRSLTFSYLLLAKTEPPSPTPATARVIGDTLKEKGKTRQMVCCGSEREFLTWMKKKLKAENIPRGSLIEIPENHSKKSNEIRLHEPVFSESKRDY